MIQMTFQSRVMFLGKYRTPGEVLTAAELQEAINKGRTTMTAVTAMKNRGLAIIQDDDESSPVDGERLGRIERNLAKIAKALNVEIEQEAEEAPAAKTEAKLKKASRRKKAA